MQCNKTCWFELYSWEAIIFSCCHLVGNALTNAPKPWKCSMQALMLGACKLHKDFVSLNAGASSFWACDSMGWVSVMPRSFKVLIYPPLRRPEGFREVDCKKWLARGWSTDDIKTNGVLLQLQPAIFLYGIGSIMKIFWLIRKWGCYLQPSAHYHPLEQWSVYRQL